MSTNWQAVKGTIVHRCVLAVGGKWLTVRDASRIDELGATPEPHLVAEGRWMAQQLGTALPARHDRLVWSLIDSGGPRWTLAYEHYLDLSPSDQVAVTADLEGPVVAAARSLLDMADEDGWQDIHCEVTNPFARLAAHTSAEKRAANWRIDLLAHRGRRSPLVVDLKTGVAIPDVDTMAHEVADQYGREVATIHDSRVTCRVLGIAFDGEVRWSESVAARPIRRTD